MENPVLVKRAHSCCIFHLSKHFTLALLNSHPAYFPEPTSSPAKLGRRGCREGGEELAFPQWMCPCVFQSPRHRLSITPAPHSNFQPIFPLIRLLPECHVLLIYIPHLIESLLPWRPRALLSRYHHHAAMSTASLAEVREAGESSQEGCTERYPPVSSHAHPV